MVMNLNKDEAIQKILDLINVDKDTGCKSCLESSKQFKEAIETHKLINLNITVSVDDLGRYEIHLDSVKKYYPKQ